MLAEYKARNIMASLEMQPASAPLSTTQDVSSEGRKFDISGPRLALVLGSLWLGGLFVALGEVELSSDF
jgi:hypothetical protein